MFLLSFANHENIIKLIGLHKADNDRDIYLVFEYMETDLHNVIKRGNILKDIHKVFIMYQLFKAIKYIHSGNVIHRDLKPSNVLLNAQCHCKIADFGLARSVTQIGEGDGESGSDPTLTDYVATRWYRAPEILVASKRLYPRRDAAPLFPGSSTINQVERIMATLPPPTDEDLISVSAGYGTNLLEKTPSGPRRALTDLLPEVSEKALDLISNLIVFNPTQRLTAVESLGHPYVADFHRRGNEPERGSSVVPLLSDDVQLTVDEYRNKLYAMMDDKHRKHKNMSKSRLRRLSEHIRKEVSGSKSNPVIGQGDATAASLQNRRTIRPPPQGDKARTMSTVETPGAQENPLVKSRLNVRNAATQYACNVTNGSLAANLPPATAKSCFYLNQQQHQHQQQQQQQQQSLLSKSQRSIQSDQMAMHTTGGRSNQLAAPVAPRAKLRRVCRQPQVLAQAPKPFALASANCRGDDQRPRTIPTKPTVVRVTGSPGGIIKQALMPSNVTKHFVRSTGSSGGGGGHLSSPESPYFSQQQAIRNYLNQTMPQRHSRPREGAMSCQDSRGSHFIERTTSCNVGVANNRTRSATRGSQATRGLDIARRRSSATATTTGMTTCDKSRFLSSHSQNHGVIAASVYRELCNGTIG
ncbi:Putative serine/threonine-protein kinase C05D10.2 [Ooceraea biroi]|uniref:Putative serine/threonine-protein kinase C05D10.2 n=1 Tax=Ooceraea biroi TaxID=2015173 RepID=A0A026WIC2_OOCBI|nr:Putative serine/threonine-protein kinase C05D10.2 [Ooceraea biroi]